MSTLLQILGHNRARIAFHLWGRSDPGGQVECDEEIVEEMAAWVGSHPKATPQDVNRRRIKVVQDVRKANFELLDDEEQEKWARRAKLIHKPTTVEEEQCFVEATLPHVVDILKLLADRGNMHFVLLASSRSSCDVPIFIQEFGRQNVEQGIFLSATDGLGARVRADYFEYALERFGGGVDDAVVLMDTAPTGDLEVDAEPDEPIARTGASRAKRKKQPTALRAVVPPFQPNLSDTKTVPKMAKAISDFVVMGVDSEPKGKKGKRAKKYEEVVEELDDDNYPSMMQDIDYALLDDALSPPAPDKPQQKASRKGKGKALRIESPPQSTNETHTPPIVSSSKLKRSRSTAISKPITAEAPDRPAPKSRPSTKQKSAIKLGTDELSHPLVLPDDEETAKIWMETKQYLDLWGGNMTHCEEQSRKMPFLGLSGIKHSIDLPAAIYSAVSILQLWSVFQAEAVGGFDVTLPLNLGLNTVKPAHHISKLISLIVDSNRPLPSAKFIHSQAPISSDAACALFLQIEAAVLRFMDEMVASEKSVLDSNLNLLQGMRLASFMSATGFIRDGGKTGSNTKRTSALSDRFVQILAAIALARYFNLLLGRMVKLYGESTTAFDHKIMWNEVESLWRPACVSLARALVARRSDLFTFNTQGVSLPKNFRALVDFAFESRPWWTPGSKGVPSFVSIPNKQAVASETFFKHLKDINWTKCSFIERGQILLLILIGAIQIETGRVKTETENPQVDSPARLLADALSSFRKGLEVSGEDGPTEQHILIPEDQVSTWISKWEMECQILTDDGPLSTVLTDENTTQTRPLPIVTEDSGAPTSSPVSVHSVTLDETSVGDRDKVETAGSQPCLGDPQASAVTSHLSYEEEDPTLPDSIQPTMSSRNQRSALVSTPQSTTLVPAVRPLENASLPVAKKIRRTREVEPCSLNEANQGTRTLRSTTAPRPVQEPSPIIPGRGSTPGKPKAAGSGGVQGSASTRITRSTASAPSAGRGRGRPANRVPTVAPSRKKKSGGGR
ncbi:hypothetical protein M407DRAFT_224161 [Tulasnella calospora MUT 4182]|uniref:Uncharacterized protein n=1 Tax=Tulasnella calospora MUT 4182 TaxID=1051891 RepID=A0A0C3KCA2_9AGAM|nr:hypothetical protein M407DRAFT_224161 [Tulasnella calospora MUT 4182]